MVSQLTTVTGDGQPSENAQLDCVAAAVDAMCRYLLGQPENSVFNPDHFKDEAVGQGYRGGTSAAAYVAFCKGLGVRLWNFRGMPALLMSEAHQQLAQGHPVMFTEPDPYVSASLGWMHVCVFYADGPGYLVAMDPYIARPIRRTDQEWTSLLLENEIWIAETEQMKIELNTPGVGNYFAGLGSTWQCKQTGKVIHDAILAFYQGYGNTALCGLTFLGLPLSNEVELPEGDGASKQYFERGCLVYDPQKRFDSPPGAGPVYLAHSYGRDALGVDPNLVQAQQMIAQLQAQVAAGDQTYAKAVGQIKPLVGQLGEIVAPL